MPFSACRMPRLRLAICAGRRLSRRSSGRVCATRPNSALTAPRPHVFDDMIFQDGEGSEDCLFLNVYAPADAKADSKLPVMFWIHGGGYAGGASSEPRHNGDFLPLKGVVLVTINYRLGVFGFLATAELAKEADGATGNYGLRIWWPRCNGSRKISSNFGGDPGECDHLRRKRRLLCRLHADGVAAGQGIFSEGDRRERRSLRDGAPLTGSLERAMKPGEALMASLGVNSLEALARFACRKDSRCRQGKAHQRHSSLCRWQSAYRAAGDSLRCRKAGPSSPAGRMESR